MPDRFAVRQTEMVGEQCTCGAALPEGARFCHKCGKPQSVAADAEETISEVIPAPQPPPAAQPAAAPVPIGFQNSVAVRVGFLAAGLISLLLSFPMPAVFSFLWQMVLLPAGGFFSVYLYSRRTGEFLTVRGGARMGWLTGIFCFVILMVLFTTTVISVASNDGMSDFYRELANQAATPEVAEQIRNFLASPGGPAALFAGILVTLFIMVTLLPAIGGMLCAKVLEKE